MEDMTKDKTIGDSKESPISKNNHAFKYEEDKSLNDVHDYIISTYNQHYVGKNNVQIQDLIIATGHGESFYIGNIIKYVTRYGRKDSKRNKYDLMKAFHYLCLLYYIHNQKEE